LIDEILELSRIEAREGRLELEPTEIFEVLSEVVGSLEPLIDGSSVVLRIDAEGDLPGLVTDRSKLRQILLNLVSNAIKYTDQGSIDLRAGAANGLLRVEVEDTGIGIPPDELTKIFDEFHRPDSADSRLRGGTGLGLSISRRLARMLGGDIVARSEVGLGSTFTLELPILTTRGSTGP
jgi:signal transduction histidine kinase